MAGMYPTLDDFFSQTAASVPPQPQQAPGMVAPAPSGTGGMIYSALAGGGREALSSLGSAVQAGAKFVGANDVAQQAAGYAQQQRGLAAQNENPDWENTSPWSPSGLAYRVLKGMPTALPMAGAALAAPEILGGGALTAGLTAAAMGYPLAVGGNVQTSEAVPGRGPLTQGEAGRALGYGVPEAAIGALPMGRLEGMFARGAEGGLLHAITGQAGAQALAGAGATAIGQQMGDPNRLLADRARDMVESALTGGATGALFGAGIRQLSKARPNTITDDALKGGIDQEVQPPTPALTEPSYQSPLPFEADPNRPYQLTPQGRLDQLSTYFKGIDEPDMFQDRLAKHVAAEQARRQQANEPSPNYIPPDQRPGVLAGAMHAPETIPQPDADQYELALDHANNAPFDQAKTLTPEALDAVQGVGKPALSDRDEMAGRLKAAREATAAGKVYPPEVASGPLSEEDAAHLSALAHDLPNEEPPTLGAPGALDALEGVGQMGVDTGDSRPIDTGPAPHPFADLKGKDLMAAVKKAAGTSPKWLDTTDFAAAQASTRKSIEASPVMRAAQERVAKSLDMLDENASLKPGVEAPAEEPSIRDAVPAQHQGRFDQLEAMRDKVPAEAAATIDDAQTKLATATRGVPQQVEATIRKLKAVAAGQKAATDLGVQPTPAAAQAAPAAQPTPAQEPLPTPAAVSKVDALIQKFQDVAANPANGGAKPDRFGGLRNAVIAAQKSLIALKGVDANEPGAKPGAVKRTNNLWDAGRADAQTRLNTFISALKKGQDPESLRGLSENHFTSGAVLDDNLDRFNAAAQQAFNDHDELQANIMDLHHKLFPPGDLFASRAGAAPRTQSDVDLTGLVNAGGTGQDLFNHIAQNGGSAANRVLASDLAKRGIDPKVQFSDPMLPHNFRSLNSWEPAGAAYAPAGDRIHLFQGSDLEQKLLHEGVHAASSKALDGNGSAAREFKQLFNAVKERMPPGDNMRDPHEFLAEGMTNPQFRDWLQGQKGVAEKASLWQKFKDGVARLMGYEGGKKTLLDQLMERGNRVMDENSGTTQPMGSRLDAEMHASPHSPSTPEGQNNSVRDWAASAEAAKGGLIDRLVSAGVSGQKIVDGFRGMDAIAAGVSEHIPSATRIVSSVDTLGNQQNVWNKHGATAAHAYDNLPADQRALHDSVAAATVGAGVDGRKPWEQQPKELFTTKNVDEIKALWRRATADWGLMTPEAKAAYQAQVDTNQAHQLAAKTILFDSAVKAKWAGLTEGFENNPASDFQLHAEVHEDPAAAKAFWANELGNRAAGTAKFVNAVASRQDPKEMASVAKLGTWLSDIKQTETSLDGVPHFRAGHGQGGYFAAGDIALGLDGRPDPRAVDKVAARLKAEGFGNLVLERSNDNPSMFTRVDSMAKAERLDSIFRDLQSDGVLSKETKVASGPVSQARLHGVGPAALHDMIDALRSSRPDMPEGTPKDVAAKYEAAWDQSINDALGDFMDMTPNSSPLKMFAHRENVQLFSRDMGATFHESIHSAARMLAVLGTAQDRGAAIHGVRSELDALKHSNAPGETKANAQNVINDIMTRLTSSPLSQPNSLIQAAQGITSRMEIGTSVPYFMLLQTQHFTRSLPELGSSHGYRNAFGAMTKATTPSWGVMRAMTQDPDWTHGGMRLDTLTKGGVAPELAKFLVRIDNQGGFIQNAYTTAMSPFQEGNGTMAKIANWSSAMGRYAEVQPRVQVAIAAKALWRGVEKDGPLDAFVLKKIAGSQQNWGTTSTPRQFTASGDLGQAGPLANQFMGYRARFTEKLYGEFHTLFAGETTADKIVAGKWLAGHLAATAVLSGAMGMPMVAVFASVYDKIADGLTGSPNHDIMGSFRHYLESVYGPSAGVAIARGIPAAMGVDLSREGDQKLVPGSDMVMYLTEKRKFEDAERDWLKNMAGSAVGVAANYVLGMRDISNGDYLNGSIKMSPEAFRGPLEAVRDTLYGYRDRGGTPLGITPNGVDIALTAMGFDPTQKATYDLNKGVLNGMEARREYQSQNIVQHLAKAIQTNGEGADFGYWAGQSGQYQQDWPGMIPPMAELGRYLDMHMRQSAIAQSMGVPMGTRPNNLRVRGMF